MCGDNERQKLGFSSFFLFCDCRGSSTYGHFLSAQSILTQEFRYHAFHMKMNMFVPNSVLKEVEKGSPVLSVLGPALDQISIWVLPGTHMIGESLKQWVEERKVSFAVIVH